MKKILATFVLFLAFSINANAQREEALKDVEALKAVVKIDPAKEHTIQSIFYSKHKFLLQSNLSEDMKNDKFKDTEKKLEAALQPSEFEKLKANAELYKRLTR
ncbi:hypothetical protein [Flavobacterium macacae]|uniref:Uncharacterized protein n=1 Tax=Flavobacterium macacae TaxID=2488993 RepID=A0A3P3W7L9_9FLAO|nr:hypothetical protein [Flavobacterium macacae]RRJ90448.1 hypothetical protein EG849_10440 [Flavobacterium macacae]